jgi:uncharacterized membrane protein YhaH (DUF805 family)
MKWEFRDLWRWEGELPRTAFLRWGAILFFLKYNLDRALVGFVFDRNWSVLSYFSQPFPGFRELLPASNQKELFILLAASLPFLWVGVLLCIKRLRSARLPLWMAVLFVVPLVKWFLFLALATIPARIENECKNPAVRSWFPKSVFGSAALAIGLTMALALGAIALSTQVLGQYGWGLFVGIPFSMGFFSSLIFGAHEERGWRESVSVAATSVALTGLLLLGLALEGVVCLVMAAPLALGLAILGALAGHVILVGMRPRIPPQLYCISVLSLPLMVGTEYFRSEPPPLWKVVTAIEVNASIGTVWRNVIEFSELPPPNEYMFKFGIAYPLRAEIRGRGPGAVRNCIFSTGPFVEPIEIWDEPYLLRFSVTHNPEPMQEWTPYRQIHPPHLNGFMVSKQGQFRLKTLPNGHTLLEGTTWYRHTLWPANYWTLWSNRIIHTIHHRVLDHIKTLAESDSHPDQPLSAPANEGAAGCD